MGPHVAGTAMAQKNPIFSGLCTADVQRAHPQDLLPYSRITVA
jgi:hypothetical protein